MLPFRYPRPFSDLLALLSVFSLDFLAVECFQDDMVSVADRYYGTTVIWVLFPVMIAALVVVVGILRAFLCRAAASGNGETQRVKNQHVYILLLLSYLILPPVSARQLASLDCVPFDHDGSSFLRADTAIDCQSPGYRFFSLFVIISLVVYRSIPLLWLVFLFRVRRELNPDTSNIDPRLALFIRDSNREPDYR